MNRQTIQILSRGLFPFIFLFTISTQVSATHTAGMDIFYRWKPMTGSDSTYEFTMVFYRNCQGFTASAPTTVTLNATSASLNITSGSIMANRLPTSGTGVPPLEPPNIYNCTKSFNSLCYEEYVYRGNWTSPQRARDWVFSYQLCCRPNTNAPTNVQNGTQYVECGLNNLDFPDYKAKNWSPLWHNRRPNHPGFLNDTVINYLFKTLCAGQYYSLDLSVREYQGDSVHYSFYWPQTNGGNPIAYINSWSFTNPMPTMNGPLTINPHTGIIPLTPGNPTGTGIYVLGVEAKEFRYDTILSGGSFKRVARQIGYVRRDMTIWIDDSSNCRRDSVHIKNIHLDSLLADDVLKVHFNNGVLGSPNSLVRCASLSPDGSEFRVVDSSNYVAPFDTTVRYIGIVSASYTCYGGMTNQVNLKLAEPLICGDYYVILKKGTDLDVIQSECGFWETTPSSGKIYTDSIKQVDIGPDTAYCRWNAFTHTLNAQKDFNGKEYASYFWNTWDTTKIINVSYAKEYWVRVTNNFQCFSTDTMRIRHKKCDTSGTGGGNGGTDTNNVGLEEAFTKDIILYPNPSRGILYIQLPNMASEYSIQAYSILGKELLSKEVNAGVNELDLSGENPGLYFIKVLDNKEIIKTFRLLIK